MRMAFTFALAAVVTAGMAATAWSQAGQAGGAGTAGAAGAAGTSGAAGAAGTSGAPGAAGTANAPTATNQAGATGVPGAPGTSGTAGFGTAGNPSGRGNVGFNGQVNGRIDRNDPQAGFNLNNGVNRRPFFSDPGVQRQLNMNQQQFNTLNRSYQDAYNQYSQNLRGLNANMPEQQRLAQMQKFENQFRADFGRSLESTISDPRARARYDQLNRQYMGFSSFNDPAIQQQLNLTPKQRLQVQQMANDWRNQLQQARRNGTQLTQQQWEQMWTQNWDQLNGVFTPEQQQTWAQLTGQRYAFGPNAYSGDRSTDGNVGVQREQNTGGLELYNQAQPAVPNAPSGSGQVAPSSTNPNPAPQGGTNR